MLQVSHCLGAYREMHGYINCSKQAGSGPSSSSTFYLNRSAPEDDFARQHIGMAGMLTADGAVAAGEMGFLRKPFSCATFFSIFKAFLYQPRNYTKYI